MTVTPTIRRARGHDPVEVDRLYDICLRTGADGADATSLYADGRLLGELYLGAYLALSPGHAFVLDDGTGPVGYVVGARDTATFEAECERRWWPALRARHPAGSAPAGSADERLVARIHAPGLADPAVLADYPAHLHVDLLPQAHGGGYGRRLLETLFSSLRADGAQGVHLGVSRGNAHAVGFYRHLGFTELSGDDGGLLLGREL